MFYTFCDKNTVMKHLQGLDSFSSKNMSGFSGNARDFFKPLGFDIKVVSSNSKSVVGNEFTRLHKPANSLVRKMSAVADHHPSTSDHRIVGLQSVNVEETIIYVLLFLLLIFLLINIIRCIKVALDPYGSVQTKLIWLDTLERKEPKNYTNLNMLRSRATKTRQCSSYGK